MVKCEYCGKEIGFFEAHGEFKDGKIICLSCNRMRIEDYQRNPEKKNIIQAKNVVINEEKIMNSTKRSNKKVRLGWMWLFIVILVIILPLFSIYTLITSWNGALATDVFNLYPTFYIVSIIDVVVSIFLIMFSIYAGLSLYFFKDKALFIAKLFLIAYLIYGIIAPFSIYFVGFPEDVLNSVSGGIGSSIFRPAIFFAVWYWFITSSKTVNRIYIDKME